MDDWEVHSTTITTYKKIEEVFIKQEPLELEEEPELYENKLQCVKTEECTSDNDEQMDKTCDNSISINNDIRQSKSTNSNGLICVECNKSFTQKSSLRRHIKLHKGIKQFQCVTCNKLFSRKFDLKTHAQLHNGIKDYECTICNKQFADQSTLTRHIKSHSEIRAHKCSTCDKSFTLNSHLKEHMLIHSGVKAYKCATCNKSFTRNSHLTRHLKVHSRKKDKCVQYAVN